MQQKGVITLYYVFNLRKHTHIKVASVDAEQFEYFGLCNQ